MKEASKKQLSTRVIAKPFAAPDAHGAIGVPIYRNAAFEFDSSQSISDAFQNIGPQKHIYTRISNPTVRHLEDLIQAASGATHVQVMASGMAAISNTFFNIACSGTNIVTSSHLFGNTYSFFSQVLTNFGVETRFVNTNHLHEIENAIDENTIAFFCEIITNPQMEVTNLIDIKPLLLKKHVPLIVDTTLIPWCGFQAKRFGVDIEVVSTTKYVSGGATSLGGAILDYATFDWSEHKALQSFCSDSLHVTPFTLRLKQEIARNLGACLSPDNAYMQTLGMETLETRYQKMSESAYKVATYLEKNPRVRQVNYSQLDSSSYKKISDTLFVGHPGAMLTFELENEKQCFELMNHLQIIRRATNLFDNKTLIIHPYSTIYGTFDNKTKTKMGVLSNVLRLSVGLESAEDIISDLEQAISRI